MAYTDLNSYLKEKFGDKVYKLSIDGGTTCPNRDGTLDWRGCIFCSSGGSGDFAACDGTITERLDRAKDRVSSKCKSGKYIAYFQSYTATYGDVDKLRENYFEAIGREDIVALSLATRPDCLSDDILVLLSELVMVKPLFVELGLQTIHDTTANLIRRHFPLQAYDEAVVRLHEIGVNVVTHVILGLPGETREQMLQTVAYAGKSSDGIKLQLLHILAGTELAHMYYKGEVDIMGMETYIDLLVDCIKILPPDIVIHRLTGDGPKSLLIAPKWSADKKRVLNAIKQRI